MLELIFLIEICTILCTAALCTNLPISALSFPLLGKSSNTLKPDVLSGIFSGFQVGPKTNPSSTQCLCNHLTFFGSSFFVVPNAIDVSKTAQLFGTFVDNPVVVTTVGCIFLIYVLVVIWARRKDIQDDAKVSLQLIKSMYSGQFPPSLACFNRKSLTNPTPFPVILCLLVSKYCSQDDKFLLTAFRNLYLQDC